MLRMLFEKMGSGIWISHLDLMKVFQRAFRRAGMQLQHTQGFNPHAFVSIALPLSVGTVSHCELLEFRLETQVPLDSLPIRLNAVLPEGIHCLKAYDGGRKLKELVWLRTETVLEYDNGVPENLRSELENLFHRAPLPVEKKSKNGPVKVDLQPLLQSLTVRIADEHTVILETVGRAQNPPLNPMLLEKAIQFYLPGMAPDFAQSNRLEIYTDNMTPFR